MHFVRWLDFQLRDFSSKGVQGAEADNRINSMLTDIQLLDKANDQSSTLSGGMKRKLW